MKRIGILFSFLFLLCSVVSTHVLAVEDILTITPPTNTPSPTLSPTLTSAPTQTLTPEPTHTLTPTPGPSITVSPTAKPTAVPTRRGPTPTSVEEMPEATETPFPSDTPIPTPTPTVVPSSFSPGSTLITFLIILSGIAFLVLSVYLRKKASKTSRI